MNPHACNRCVVADDSMLASPRRCAFESGAFSPDNWNCGTANAVRDKMKYPDPQEPIAYDSFACRDDMAAGSAGMFLIPENETVSGYVVASWYKDRGKTGQIWVFSDDAKPRPITLAEAEAVLACGNKVIS